MDNDSTVRVCGNCAKFERIGEDWGACGKKGVAVALSSWVLKNVVVSEIDNAYCPIDGWTAISCQGLPEVIFPEDDAAASPVLFRGWVSSKGNLYRLDADGEKLARLHGATKTHCGCGAVCDVYHASCNSCRAAKKQADYDAKTKVKWDGETPIYSDRAEEYFFCFDEIQDAVHEYGVHINELRLFVCAPNHAKPIDEEIWNDDYPEDEGAPEWLLEEIDKFNDKIKGRKPLSWSPSSVAVTVDGIEYCCKNCGNLMDHYGTCSNECFLLQKAHEEKITA